MSKLALTATRTVDLGSVEIVRRDAMAPSGIVSRVGLVLHVGGARSVTVSLVPDTTECAAEVYAILSELLARASKATP